MALVLVARAGVDPSLFRLKGGAPHRKRNARGTSRRNRTAIFCV